MLYQTVDDALLDWKWKFFTPQELRCKGSGKVLVVPETLDRLTRLREEFDAPLPLTSGYRSPEYNAIVAGTGKAGPHTTGRAFDIAISGSAAIKLIRLACAHGFTGIGVKQHGEGRFVHIDDLENVDGACPRPWIWSYT